MTGKKLKNDNLKRSILRNEQSIKKKDVSLDLKPIDKTNEEKFRLHWENERLKMKMKNSKDIFKFDFKQF